MSMTLDDIRKLATDHDHFLIERPIRTLAWFALAVLEALDAAGCVDDECCETDHVTVRHLRANILRNLGSLLHQQGQIQEARDAFATGEALLRQVGAQIDLGRLLAVRAEMELDVGNSEAARSLLHETEVLMEGVHSSPNSEFQRKLDQLRQALADRP